VLWVLCHKPCIEWIHWWVAWSLKPVQDVADYVWKFAMCGDFLANVVLSVPCCFLGLFPMLGSFLWWKTAVSGDFGSKAIPGIWKRMKDSNYSWQGQHYPTLVHTQVKLVRLGPRHWTANFGCASLRGGSNRADVADLTHRDTSSRIWGHSFFSHK